jgi:hypothetical protein
MVGGLVHIYLRQLSFTGREAACVRRHPAISRANVLLHMLWMDHDRYEMELARQRAAVITNQIQHLVLRRDAGYLRYGGAPTVVFALPFTQIHTRAHTAVSLFRSVCACHHAPTHPHPHTSTRKHGTPAPIHPWGALTISFPSPLLIPTMASTGPICPRSGSGCWCVGCPKSSPACTSPCYGESVTPSCCSIPSHPPQPPPPRTHVHVTPGMSMAIAVASRCRGTNPMHRSHSIGFRRGQGVPLSER